MAAASRAECRRRSREAVEAVVRVGRVKAVVVVSCLVGRKRVATLAAANAAAASCVRRRSARVRRPSGRARIAAASACKRGHVRAATGAGLVGQLAPVGHEIRLEAAEQSRLSVDHRV